MLEFPDITVWVVMADDRFGEIWVFVDNNEFASNQIFTAITHSR